MNHLPPITNEGISVSQRLRVRYATGFKPRASSLKSRAGISVTEVLIAMGVLAVGLLGVAAIFPVGGHYMQRAEISDRADAIAQAALNDAITRGLLDPENWVAYEDNDTAKGDKDWGAHIPLGNPDTFTRPFAADFRTRLREIAIANSGNIAADNQRLNNSVGSVIVVDPHAIASSIDTTTPFGVDGILSAFPASVASARASGGGTGGLVETPTASIDSFSDASSWLWAPWTNIGWPIQRVTVETSAPIELSRGEPMLFAEADRFISGDDDLAIDLPDEPDAPSQQLVQTSGTTPLLRQSRHEFSWMLTVSPTSFEAWRAFATGGDASYDVSAVVFHKRPLGSSDAVSPADVRARDKTLLRAERLVRASITSTSPSGGDVRLYLGDPSFLPYTGSAEDPLQYDNHWIDPVSHPAVLNEPAWKDLKTGQWMFLFGPHPLSTNQRPLLFARWYRVLAIDRTDEEVPASAVPGFRRSLAVSLRGPDWPWTAGDNSTDDPIPSELSENLHAVIVPDVVSVHTRTLNLQSAAVWGE